ncbi:acyl-CoA dehydrogenase family protein [Neorhizobium galegae]|uniref:acyl-CoA dehydrogenase family protein n=1 Tax=Neorhizobium galegae TaxID=399 RepID=UPI0012743411|nr:acyl-CoA dehydrogenase family protein [Neorhizobium galegae]KAA9386202.1 acyl-CoA dehydrogenase [Neorhizobium galegae]KAB1113355.1 acyl-CoA dehydrogenase [Neorhizobium galegae]MCM2496304.1 acyl-CoA dehydrogenase family protein [Neorhizobium galegae]MCQ1770560.1 acyl-CoA dehydrogenase family protein [Neorhizobium galegae]
MTAATELKPARTVQPNAIGLARSLGPAFAARAADADGGDAFVADNYRDLRHSGLIEAGVPADLGGGGAEVRELCDMIRELAHHCGSTALAFSMHTHQVAIPAWRWTHQKAAPVMPLLKRVAAERIILLSSGGSDWIEGSGKAEKVDGGYRITGRKIFTSGSPIGDILMTGAVLDEPDGPKVLHFGLPMKSPHVKVLDTWKVMGMRGTGSNDVMIEGHVVPEEAVALKRNQGEWHMLFHIISMIAFPLIYSAYLGVAESARDIAIEMAKRKEPNAHVIDLAGRMETELKAAQYAHAGMIAAAERDEPSPATTNEIMIGRSLVARHAIAATELAMETAGGAAFYRDKSLERRFRDIQGARYHPMRTGPQQEFSGRIALGLDTLRTF